MMKLRREHGLVIALALLAGVTTGCPADGPTAGGTETAGTAQTPATGLPGGLKLATSPDGEALGVSAAKASAKEGETIVLRGRIGGTFAPFVEGRAAMTIADEAMDSCDSKEGDGCTAPWDYCCETPEDILANTATIQVVGEDGRPLAVSLRELGAKELATVVVQGTVGPRPDPKVLIVNATGIWVAD